MQTLRLGEADDYVLYDPARVESPGAWLFDPASSQWQATQAIAAGRGRVSFLRHGDAHWVLRHYARGGLPARLGLRHYLWTGLHRSRPWREFHLLAHLHAEGLPVPVPVAARVCRRHLLYGGALLTCRIDGAVPLRERLAQSALDPSGWRSVGRLCAALHARGVHHSDLNVGNLLIDAAGGLHVIDFDNARERAPRWLMAAGLRRLRRSLRKARRREPGLHFDARCWQWLMEGYRAGGGHG